MKDIESDINFLDSLIQKSNLDLYQRQLVKYILTSDKDFNPMLIIIRNICK